MDRYFQVSNIPVAKKLEYVVLTLHGEAITWFEWWESQSSFHTWIRFKQDLLKRFEPGAASNPMASLLKVKQMGTVMEYRREFELAARSHRHLGGDILLCMFHEGLKPTIKSEMTVEEFENLQAMMDRAMVLEARNDAWKDEGIQPRGKRTDSNIRSGWATSRPNNGPRPNTHTLSTEANTPHHSVLPKVKSKSEYDSSLSKNPNAPKHHSHWISNEEWTERQRKGLCFQCGDKWNPSNKCKFRHQQLILLSEYEPTPVLDESDSNAKEQTVGLNTLSLHLSSLSYWGLMTHHTLKARGTING